MSMSVDACGDGTFAEQLYLLSTVIPVKDHNVRRNKRRWLMGRMQLLDGIALLLCTGEKREAAAVTFEETGAGTNLFYCKNRPCDEKEKSYVSNLLQIVKDATRYEACVLAILDHAVPECQAKIKSRLGKLAREISNIRERSPDGQILFKPSAYFEGHIHVTLKNSVPDDMPMKKFLGTVIDILESLRLDNPGVLVDLMEMAYFIGIAKDVHTVIPHPMLVWRLQKFGGFFSAAKDIAWITMFDRDISKRKNLITVTEISPAPPIIEIMTGSPIQILNRFAKSIGRDPVSPGALKDAYEDFEIQQEIPDGEESPALKEIESTVHCELNLLTFMAQRRFEIYRKKYVSMTVEIGTSKRTCWTCQAYIVYMEASYRSPCHPGLVHEPLHDFNCVVSEYSGKVTAGWTMPTDFTNQNGWLLPRALVLREIRYILAHIHERQQNDLEWEACSNERAMQMTPESDTLSATLTEMSETVESDNF